MGVKKFHLTCPRGGCDAWDLLVDSCRQASGWKIDGEVLWVDVAYRESDLAEKIERFLDANTDEDGDFVSGSREQAIRDALNEFGLTSAKN